MIRKIYRGWRWVFLTCELLFMHVEISVTPKCNRKKLYKIFLRMRRMENEIKRYGW